MQRIVLTGGNSGMGRETVIAFLKNGDKVTFTSRSTKASQEMMEELSEYAGKGQLFFCQCDQSKSEDVQKLVAFVDEKMGGCDVLVNNAAIFIGGEVADVPEEAYDLQMAINVKGPFLMSKYFLPQMLERGCGNIINVSSLSGKRGGYNCAVYSASKAAVNNLTRCMALDYMARGVRSNAINPSATATKMFLTGSTQEVIDGFNNNNPAGRISKPEEIADLILFLASDQSKFINGQCISIDGGLSAWTAETKQNKTEVLK